MGQLKEAGYVATQHAIKDLKEDVTVCNTIVPPLPIVPTITVISVSTMTTIVVIHEVFV